MVSDEEVVRATDQAYRLLHVRRDFRPEDRDDVYQEIFMALWRARERFDPEKSSWNHYSLIIARGAVLDYLRSHVVGGKRWHRSMVHEPYIQTFVPLEKITWMDATEDRMEKLDEEDTLSPVTNAKARFVALALMSGYKQSEIARLMGLTERRVYDYIIRLVDGRSKYSIYPPQD